MRRYGKTQLLSYRRTLLSLACPLDGRTMSERNLAAGVTAGYAISAKGSASLLGRSRLGQFESPPSRGGCNSVAFACYLHGGEGEFDAVFIERFFDHCIGLTPDDELLTRHSHHLGPDLDRVITELVDPLHLQGLEDQRGEFGVLGEIQSDLLDQLRGEGQVAVIGDADRDLVDDPIAAHVFDRAQ